MTYMFIILHTGKQALRINVNHIISYYTVTGASYKGVVNLDNGSVLYVAETAEEIDKIIF